MLTSIEDWHANEQELATWVPSESVTGMDISALATRVPSESVTGIFQPCLCLCPSPLAACTAPDGAFCHSLRGSGPGLGNSPREKSNITAQRGEFCSPCSFTTLGQVFLCCCFICHPITSRIKLSHLTAGKYAF